MSHYDFYQLSHISGEKCYRLNLGVDFTLFEAVELENDEFIYVELVRDLESDCDVTISVTCRISSNKNDTRSILVLILPYLGLRNPKIMKRFMRNFRVTQKVTVTSRFP